MRVYDIGKDYFDFSGRQLATALESWRRDYPKNTWEQLWARFNAYSLTCAISSPAECARGYAAGSFGVFPLCDDLQSRTARSGSS